MARVPKSPYLKPGRLGDVLAAIQTMAIYDKYRQSSSYWSVLISGDQSNESHRKTIFDEHPELFRPSSAHPGQYACPGPAPRTAALKYQAEGQNLKRTNEGTDAAGKPANNEWVNIFDGQPHPSPGPGYDTSAYTRIDPSTFHFTRLKAGKIVQSGFGVLSRDGKTFTVTTIGTGPNGEQINNVAVYDKQ
jgi:hypothetical protein